MLNGIMPLVSAAPLGTGNVYYVVKSTETIYSDFIRRHQKYYRDSATTSAVYTDIQKALDATVECRNDYVVVMPSNSDYDITEVLTLTKKSVHLVCPAGLGYERGAPNACRIHQNTAATSIFAISDASIEIAGFYLKPYAGIAHVTVATGGYALNIHHNLFNLQTTSSNAAAIACTGDAGGHGYVAHHCYFLSGGGDDQTTAIMINVDPSATGARVDYNDFFVGDGNIYTVVVSNLATKGSVNYNNFMIAGSDGTMTHCVKIHLYGSAIGNRACVGDGAIITGGVNDVTNCDNMNAVNGGAVDDLD